METGVKKMINARPELSLIQKTLLKKLKEEWGEIPHRGIFFDRRKKFYRVKMWVVTTTNSKKAKNIAMRLGFKNIMVQHTSSPYFRIHSHYPRKYVDCIIKIPYSWF